MNHMFHYYRGLDSTNQIKSSRALPLEEPVGNSNLPKPVGRRVIEMCSSSDVTNAMEATKVTLRSCQGIGSGTVVCFAQTAILPI